MESIQEQIAVHKSIEHPFIASFYHTFEEPPKVFLAMEYVDNGTLLKYINDRQRLTEQESRRIFYQILSAFDYLHGQQHIVHRDFKAENVLLDSNFNIRIVDFGFSKRVRPGGALLNTACGSPAYVAPEVLMQEAYGSPADIWSAGVVLYLMIVGYLPFNRDNMSALIEDILSVTPRFPPDVSPVLADLILRMLDKDPVTRITLPEIRLNQWIAGTREAELLASDFVLIARLRTFDIESLDEGVAGEMRALGIDLTGLVEELKAKVVNLRTAAYRILMRQRAAGDIRDWQQLKPLGRSESAGNPRTSKLVKPSFSNVSPVERRRSEVRGNFVLAQATAKFRSRKPLPPDVQGN
jgi:5'-AMP-activated protein kinase catalytic alpha subunit